MSTLSANDRHGIAAIRSDLVSAILAGDSSAYAQCFTADGILMHPDTPLVRGREALKAYGAQVFAVVNVTKLVLTPITVRSTRDTAFEVGVQELAITPANDKFTSQRQYIHVYEKQPDGMWKIPAAMSGNQ